MFEQTWSNMSKLVVFKRVKFGSGPRRSLAVFGQTCEKGYTSALSQLCPPMKYGSDQNDFTFEIINLQAFSLQFLEPLEAMFLYNLCCKVCFKKIPWACHAPMGSPGSAEDSPTAACSRSPAQKLPGKIRQACHSSKSPWEKNAWTMPKQSGKLPEQSPA